MKEVVELLKERQETIATMESCTGGGVANAITNIEGASSVLLFSAVTYSNEYKIKMGVQSKTIDTYSVYSEEVAREMSKQISLFAHSTYGVGVTGKINREDPNNKQGSMNQVFISIYQQSSDSYDTECLSLPLLSRPDCKEIIIKKIEEKLLSVLQGK